jgi:hypothetical protein
MSQQVEQLAEKIADQVYRAVSRAHYSREHIARTGHRAAYLASYTYLCQAMEIKIDAAQLAIVAKAYEDRRQAAESAGIRQAFEAVFGQRKQAIG